MSITVCTRVLRSVDGRHSASMWLEVAPRGQGWVRRLRRRLPCEGRAEALGVLRASFSVVDCLDARLSDRARDDVPMALTPLFDSYLFDLVLEEANRERWTSVRDA